MTKVIACDVPEGSLLAAFGGQRDEKAQDYRDCFYRDVPGEVTLGEYIERFYCSAAFRPERLAPRLGADGADVLADAGFDAGEIAELQDAGVLHVAAAR